MPGEGLAAELRAKAAELGLAAIGFAAASPMEGTRRVIEQRKAAGLDAGMQFTYRSPNRSTRVRKLPKRTRNMKEQLRRAYRPGPTTKGGLALMP